MDIEKLRAAVRYEPETGMLFWRERADMPKFWNSKHAGKRAFVGLSHNGYRTGRFAGRILRASRVAFAIMEGRWPDQIDHIDGSRRNDKWENLREVNASQQAKNKKKRRDNKTGIVGVYWIERDQAWGASCGNRKLGQFKDKNAAIAAREAALALDKEYHPNHGRITS